VFRLSLPEGNAGGLPEPFHSPISLRIALARHADLLSSPSKTALKLLAQIASNEVS
jgi:hypothetical protein